MHKDFWNDVESGGKKQEAKTKRKFKNRVFDDVDEYMEFDSEQNHDPSKDDTKGSDYKVDLEVDFFDAINGLDTKVELDKRITCHSCKGRRADLSK
jgi:DnaJ-class molecular chaperone